jgi:CRISPR-associated protein Cas1
VTVNIISAEMVKKNPDNFIYKRKRKCRAFGEILENREKVLNFEIPEIKPYRNDDIELRNRIMAITPEDRKKLKINKSTLWYMQKAIKEGKKIKLYK